MSLTPKSWASFQHYKDRSPIWIKLHRALLDNYEFHCLPVASRALAPMLWLLASEYEGGRITLSIPAMAFRLRMTEPEIGQALKPLIDGGFFVEDSNPLADGYHDAIPEKERETQEKIEKERERNARARAFALQVADEFMKFWDEYPNKVGKPKAAEKFLKARKTASFEEIMAGLRRYVAKKDDRPWCNPETFINQQRWNDQPAGSVQAPITRQLVNVLEGTEEMDAWDRHWRQTKGVNAPRSKHGGIFVETQWPPGGEHERGADREIAPQQAVLRAGSGSFTSG